MRRLSAPCWLIISFDCAWSSNWWLITSSDFESLTNTLNSSSSSWSAGATSVSSAAWRGAAWSTFTGCDESAGDGVKLPPTGCTSVGESAGGVVSVKFSFWWSEFSEFSESEFSRSLTEWSSSSSFLTDWNDHHPHNLDRVNRAKVLIFQQSFYTSFLLH